MVSPSGCCVRESRRQGPGFSSEIEIYRDASQVLRLLEVARGLASRLRLKSIKGVATEFTIVVARGLASRLRLKYLAQRQPANGC